MISQMKRCIILQLYRDKGVYAKNSLINSFSSLVDFSKGGFGVVEVEFEYQNN